MSNESKHGDVHLSNDFIAICIASCVRTIEGVVDFDDSLPQNLSIYHRFLRCANTTARMAYTENCKDIC